MRDSIYICLPAVVGCLDKESICYFLSFNDVPSPKCDLSDPSTDTLVIDFISYHLDLGSLCENNAYQLSMTLNLSLFNAVRLKPSFVPGTVLHDQML